MIKHSIAALALLVASGTTNAQIIQVDLIAEISSTAVLSNESQRAESYFDANGTFITPLNAGDTFTISLIYDSSQVGAEYSSGKHLFAFNASNLGFDATAGSTTFSDGQFSAWQGGSSPEDSFLVFQERSVQHVPEFYNGYRINQVLDVGFIGSSALPWLSSPTIFGDVPDISEFTSVKGSWEVEEEFYYGNSAPFGGKKDSASGRIEFNVVSLTAKPIQISEPQTSVLLLVLGVISVFRRSFRR